MTGSLCEWPSSQAGRNQSVSPFWHFVLFVVASLIHGLHTIGVVYMKAT